MRTNPIPALRPTSGLLFLVCIFIYSSFGQENAVVIGERRTIRSDILGEDRTVMVYHPDTTFISSDRYPVLYLLDGPTHFHHVSGLVQFLAQNRIMPPTLIVGIANTSRGRDFTPLPADTTIRGSGGADPFLGFITKELIPYVDANYRTAPFRILIGHSLGGLLTVHAFLSQTNAFEAFVAVSPTLWWNNGGMVNQLADFLKQQNRIGKHLYLTVGNEGDRMVLPTQQFVKVLESRPVDGLKWKFDLMKKEDHGSIVHRAIYDALEHVFDSWKIPNNLTEVGITGLEKLFKQLADQYGFGGTVPEGIVNELGYRLLFDNKIDDAISVFKYNVQHYPRSWNVYDSLGEAYLTKGDRALAVENYKKSLQINPASQSGIEALGRLDANW